MDTTTLANLIVATAGIKVVEALGEESGKTLFSLIGLKAKNLISMIQKYFTRTGNQRGYESLSKLKFEQLSSDQEEIKLALEKAKQDAKTMMEILEQGREIRNTLLSCLEQNFTAEELDQLSFQMGFLPGKLFTPMTTNTTKAISILNAIEKQKRFPELIRYMLAINPNLV